MRAQIVQLKDFESIRPKDTIICASGGFDPIHPGHLSYLEEAKEIGGTLVTIVNGDNFLKRKKGKPFMNLETRCYIVSCIKWVDIVVPFETEVADNTVKEALKILKPDFFAKGGDRTNAANIPEWNTCLENNIKVITNVGNDKLWSSSDFLKEWGEFFAKNKRSTNLNLQQLLLALYSARTTLENSNKDLPPEIEKDTAEICAKIAQLQLGLNPK